MIDLKRTGFLLNRTDQVQLIREESREQLDDIKEAPALRDNIAGQQNLYSNSHVTL
jgi:hypothetical protein